LTLREEENSSSFVPVLAALALAFSLQKSLIARADEGEPLPQAEEDLRETTKEADLNEEADSESMLITKILATLAESQTGRSRARELLELEEILKERFAIPHFRPRSSLRPFVELKRRC
jgi:hypothetical protein